ncbi:MAG: hypothetical protein IPI49_12425 [Myxococcales bacterium]|nr:hypothetical protein [Myxococcales bacterium]
MPLTATTGQSRWRGERIDSWDAAATIARIQHRADAAPSAPIAAPAASPPPTFPAHHRHHRHPHCSHLSPIPARPRWPPRGLWDDLDRHSAIERWVLAEMDATGVDPLSIGRPLPDHLQHPSQRPSQRRS